MLLGKTVINMLKKKTKLLNLPTCSYLPRTKTSSDIDNVKYFTDNMWQDQDPTKLIISL